MTKPDVIRFLILRTIGNFLLLFALFGVFATFGPSLYYEARFRIAQVRGVRYTVVETVKESKRTPLGEIVQKRQGQTPSGLAAVLAGPKEQILTPPDTTFSIIIPKIGASAKVFPNIDSNNESGFLPILSQGVAHAKGTVFPGQIGNIYLFAHSTDNFWNVGRYNAVFYLLKDIAVGYDVVVFFENVRHNYTVEETKIVDAEDVSYLIESQRKEEERLVLQTCWPPGTTWKRLIVIAKPQKTSL